MFETARPFLLALIIGLVIGIERERAISPEDGKFPLGSRTFTLLALLGAVAASAGDPVLAGVLAAFAGAVILGGYFRTRLSASGSGIGVTTEVAGMVTFSLGYLAYGRAALAVMLSVLTLAVLASKSQIHRFARAGLREGETNAAIVFLVLAFVVLPLLPDENVDPWGLVNPARLWLIFVLVTGIGFGGYIAVRLLGPGRGLAAAGLLAGLISSTAATVALAQKGREGGRFGEVATGVVLANVASAAAQIMVVAIAAPRLVMPVLPVVGAPVVVGLLAVWLARPFLHGRGAADEDRGHDRGAFTFQSPIALRPSAMFAGILALVLAASSMASRAFGATGVLVAAAVGGAANVHAATLAVSTLAAGGEVDPRDAVLAVLIGFLANMAVKLALVAWVGGSRLLVALAPPLVAMSLAGVVAFLVTAG